MLTFKACRHIVYKYRTGVENQCINSYLFCSKTKQSLKHFPANKKTVNKLNKRIFKQSVCEIKTL